MKISQRGLNLIKNYEGFSAEPYICPAGKLTIGYGHVILEDEEFDVLTEQEANELLQEDCTSRERCVQGSVRVPLNQNEFDALVSFVYNLGCGALQKSTLLKKLNSGDKLGASQEFLRWDKANGKPLAGLTKRRQAESKLFNADVT